MAVPILTQAAPATRIVGSQHLCCYPAAACQPLDNLVPIFQLHARVIVSLLFPDNNLIN
jgi:hypothetical protein